MVRIFSSEQKLTGGISFTMQFPMATVKKNALYVEKSLMNWRVLPLVKINTRMLIGTNK
jgi:hypothetical protein